MMGVRRILKWIEYLTAKGIKTAVLTVLPTITPSIDPTPLEFIKNNKIPVFRSGSADPYRLKYILESLNTNHGQNMKESGSQPKPSGKGVMEFLRQWIFIPDDRIGWAPFAILKGIKAVKKFKPDVIISTSYPNSAHLVGFALKKIFGVPWIADFRDGWSQNPTFFPYKASIFKNFSKSLEKSVVKNADAIVSVSPPITEFLKTLAPSQGYKFKTIFNGYDPADFLTSGLSNLMYDSMKKAGCEKIRFVYTGTLYGRRSPVGFFKAAAALLTEKSVCKDELEICFYTKMPDVFLKEIKEYGLENTVKLMDFLPYKECLKIQSEASALLLFLPKEKNTEIMVTQKVFEYLASGRPILAIIPNGACKDVLSNTGGAVFADPNNPEEIKQALHDLIKSLKNGNPPTVNKDVLSQYTRESQTDLLLEVVKQVLSAKK